MKVQRYTGGRTNVSELERQRAGALSPQEAAAAARAKSAAISSISGELAQQAQGVTERRQRLEAQADQRAARLGDAELKLRLKQFTSDPRWNQTVQEDGTPTVRAMSEAWAEESRAIREQAMGRFIDPNRRAEFEEIYDLGQQGAALEVDNIIDEKRVEADQAYANDLYLMQLEIGDYDAARQSVDEMLEKGYITEAAGRTLVNAIEAETKQENLNVYAIGAEKAIKDGTYDEYLSAVNEEDFGGDQGLKFAVIGAVEQVKTNYDQSVRNARLAQETQVIESFETLMTGISTGNMPMYVDDQGNPVNPIEGWYAIAQATTEDGRPEFKKEIERMKGRLARAQFDGAKTDAAMASLTDKMNAGLPLPNTETYREAAKEYTSDQMAIWEAEQEAKGNVVTDADRWRKMAQLSQGMHLVPEQLHSGIVDATGHPEFMLNMMDGWRVLHQDPTNIPKGIEVSEDDHMLWTAMEVQTRGGTPEQKLRVAEELVSLRNKRLEKGQAWADAANIELNEDGGLLDSEIDSGLDNALEDLYGANLIWINKLNPDDEAMARGIYERGFIRHYRAYRDKKTAHAYAQQSFARNYPQNNINGDPALQYGGLPGDVRPLALNYLAQLERDNNVLIVSDGSGYTQRTMDTLDKGSFTYANPRVLAGDWIYDLYYEGERVMEKNADGEDSTVSVSFGPEDTGPLYQWNELQKEVKELERLKKSDFASAQMVQAQLAVGPGRLPQDAAPDYDVHRNLKEREAQLMQAREDFLVEYPQFRRE